MHLNWIMQLVIVVPGHAFVNCYGLGLTGRYSIFCIDFLYIDRVRHNYARISLFSKSRYSVSSCSF